MSDMYTDVERSIHKALKDEITRRGWTYKVFNNMVSKKDFGDQHAALSIMRISDVPNPENGGGVKAVIKSLNGNQFDVEEWPDAFDLLYQFTVVADDLKACRDLDSVIRYVFRPKKKPLYLYDSVNDVMTENYCNFTYAGYINRDVPSDDTYWRVTNIRFEAFNYSDEVVQVPVIQQVNVDITVDDLPSPAVVGLPAFPQQVSFVGDGNNRVFGLPSVPPSVDKMLVFWGGAMIKRLDPQNNPNWTVVGNILTTVSFTIKADDDFVIVF